MSIPTRRTRWAAAACALAFLITFHAPAFGQTTPVIGGVADAAFRATTVAAPGSILSILGTDLIPEVVEASCSSDIPWPTEVTPCGVTVTAGDQLAAVGFAGREQLNIQLPWDLPLGPVELVVEVEGADPSEPVEITIQQFAPSVFGLFFDENGTQIGAETPAVPGEIVRAFAAGLGAAEIEPALGDLPAGESATLGTARVFLQLAPDEPAGVAQNEGEVEAEVVSALLSADSVGTYVVDFRLPAELEPGNYTWELEMSDAEGLDPVRGASRALIVGLRPLTLNGVVNGASFAEGGAVAPGTIVSVFASGLGTTRNQALFPETNHEGLSVTFDGVAAPLFAVVPESNQINVLAPADLPETGTVDVVVQFGEEQTDAFQMEMTEAAPGVFPVNDPNSDRIFAAATLANTAWFSIPDSVSEAIGLPVNCTENETRPTSFCGQPAQPGDRIQIFATGLGRATPDGDPVGDLLPTGEVAPLDQLYLTLMEPSVTIGDIPAEVRFSGLAPGFSGLYQINVVVPEGVETGDEVTLTITMPNGASTSTLIAVRP